MKSTHKHHFIPRPYYRLATYALKLYRSSEIPFSECVDLAISSFTADKFAPDYIPRTHIDRRKLVDHIISYIRSD